MTDAGIISSSNDTWRKPEFWEKICGPHLSIGKKGEESTAKNNGISIPEEVANQRRKGLVDNGYTLVNDSLPNSLVQTLLEGIENLQGKNKYPASFILLFDQVWQMARISRKIMRASTHDSNQFHWDILAWYIDQPSGGFSPHRDRQPDDAKATFHSDEQAKFVTHWIALSDATPETSCLYVIPKPQDPGYTDGDTENEEPLARALPHKTAFQQIRALPRDAGTSLLFTHRIIHWGSARDSDSNLPPRVAISFVGCDPTFEKPYLVNAQNYFDDDNHNKTPPFHIRLLLVCAQLLIYYQRFDLPKETIKVCYDYCKEYEAELEPEYRKKVYLEFVNSMKEAKGDQLPAAAAASTKAPDNNDSDADDEEAVLEEMLNAEQGGYGEFQDDYDEEAGGDDEALAGEEDEDFEDDNEEEGVSLFGKPNKRIKPNDS